MVNNNNKPPHKRPIKSVDGFVSHGGRQLHHGQHQPKPLPNPNLQSTDRSQQFMSHSRLDNFKASDGFHSVRQPVIEPALRRRLDRQPRRDKNGKIDLSLTPAPKKRKKRNWKKIALRSGIGVGLVAVLIVGFLFAKGIWKLHQVFHGGGGAASLEANVDPNKLKGEGDGRVNILVLGIGGDGHQAPDLSDTMMIASIDPVQKQAALLSIPRDLWVKPDGFGYMKINSVYANNKYAALYKKYSEKDAIEYGLSAVEKEVSKDMGIPIHYHVLIDAHGFEQAVNTVGGVDINVDAQNTVHEVLWDDIRNKTYVLDVKAGQQHFDGQRATFYARSRETSQRGDFDRTERQRLLIIALKNKIFSLGTFSNPLKVSQLLDNFGNHISANLTTNEMMRLYQLGKDINNIGSIGLADPPNNFVTTDNVDGLSIVRPRKGLTDFSEIQNYVRNALKDSYLAQENAKIMILNGTTTAGLGTKKQDELKSYGYNVISVGNAPTQTYSKTILVDLRSGQKKYTKHYLEQRLNLTAVNSLPDNTITPGDADFVIILGAN